MPYNQLDKNLSNRKSYTMKQIYFYKYGRKKYGVV